MNNTHSKTIDLFVDFLNINGETTPIWVRVEGSGVPALCKVSARQVRDMLAGLKKFANSEDVIVEYEFKPLESIIIVAIED